MFHFHGKHVLINVYVKLNSQYKLKTRYIILFDNLISRCFKAILFFFIGIYVFFHPFSKKEHVCDFIQCRMKLPFSGKQKYKAHMISFETLTFMFTDPRFEFFTFYCQE